MPIYCHLPISILCGQLRDINDTVYYMPHHSIPEKPANIQPVTTIQFPSILSELGGVVNVTVAKPKRKLLVQALAEFDIKLKKATTFLNRGQLMLQASHDQLVAKVRSILENQSCENNSIGHQAQPTAPSAGPQIYPLLTLLLKKVNLTLFIVSCMKPMPTILTCMISIMEIAYSLNM